MDDHTNTYPDLVNVEDWLSAKGYTGEAGACHQAMSLIRKQDARIAALEAALLPFAAIADESTANLADNYMYPDCYPMSAFRAAKAALEKKA
jgi:hypothetical protein